MLDTIVLTLDQRQFEVLRPDRFSPSAQGLLKPPYYPLGARGNFACVQNPTKEDLKAGRYLPRLTLAKRKVTGGFASTLKVEFSAPKLIYGNNSGAILKPILDAPWIRAPSGRHRRNDHSLQMVIEFVWGNNQTSTGLTYLTAARRIELN